MAHPACGFDNATLPRSSITHTQLNDGDSISRYRTFEATRIFATFVNASDEELEDAQSYLSFPHTESSDIFGDSDSEFSYNTRATTPSESPVKPPKAVKALHRRSRSVGEFRYVSMENLHRVPTPTPTLNSVPGSKAQRAEVIDPFSADADTPSYIADDSSSTFPTPPPSYRSNPGTPSRRRLVKQSKAPPSYSRPPTSCSRGSSAYAGELGHMRRCANSPLKSSTINAPTSGAKPGHRRRTSSLSSLDSVISSAGQSISKFVKRTVKHSHNNLTEKPLPPTPITDPDHSPKHREPIRPRRLSWVPLAAPNICLLETLPSYFDSQHRPTPTVSHEEDANLTPGEPVGTPRDLLMWKTDEDYLRREGFLCSTAEDFGELRLRAPDDDPDFYAAPEPQRCVDELGIVYTALTCSRDEIAINSEKKKEPRTRTLSATPSPTAFRKLATGRRPSLLNRIAAGLVR